MNFITHTIHYRTNKKECCPSTDEQHSFNSMNGTLLYIRSMYQFKVFSIFLNSKIELIIF